MTAKREKTVKIAELKAKLSAYVRAAQRGQEVVVYDRDTPIARLVPYATAGEDTEIKGRPPIRPLRDWVPPKGIGRYVDVVGFLMEERRDRYP